MDMPADCCDCCAFMSEDRMRAIMSELVGADVDRPEEAVAIERGSEV